MDFGISGRSALVLAGGGGLGSAISTMLAGEGVRVTVADLDIEAAERTSNTINAAGGNSVAVSWNLGDLDEGRRIISGIQQSDRAVDILVNITGGPPPTQISDQPRQTWRDQFDAMVLSVVELTDAVLPRMRAQKWGRVITSTSSGVLAPIPNLGLSNALRSHLVGWSKTLAREVGPYGITSNLLVPGRIATPRISFLDEKRAQREGRPLEEIQTESWAAIPVGRYGRPEEYAAACVFLASQQASYITGSVLRVDGGFIASI